MTHQFTLLLCLFLDQKTSAEILCHFFNIKIKYKKSFYKIVHVSHLLRSFTAGKTLTLLSKLFRKFSLHFLFYFFKINPAFSHIYEREFFFNNNNKIKCFKKNQFKIYFAFFFNFLLLF